MGLNAGGTWSKDEGDGTLGVRSGADHDDTVTFGGWAVHLEGEHVGAESGSVSSLSWVGESSLSLDFVHPGVPCGLVGSDPVGDRPVGSVDGGVGGR